MIAVSCVIGAMLLLLKPNTEHFDSFGSLDSRDPGVVCNSYGEGHVVCSEAPPGVKRYREAQRARAKREKSGAP